MNVKSILKTTLMGIGAYAVAVWVVQNKDKGIEVQFPGQFQKPTVTVTDPDEGESTTYG